MICGIRLLNCDKLNKYILGGTQIFTSDVISGDPTPKGGTNRERYPRIAVYARIAMAVELQKGLPWIMSKVFGATPLHSKRLRPAALDSQPLPQQIEATSVPCWGIGPNGTCQLRVVSARLTMVSVAVLS